MLRYGSLCSGIGGLDLAVEHVYGAEPSWFCESDEHARSVLVRHWPNVPIYPDLRDLPDDLEPVDIIAAGYPCQPFSHAGRRRGTDDPRHLWPRIADTVRVLRPRVLVCENVRAHLGNGFTGVLSDLAGLRMDARWMVVRASDVGAAHRRARLFFVATDSDSHGRESGAGGSRRVASAPGQDPGVRSQWERLWDPPPQSDTTTPDSRGVGLDPGTGLRESGAGRVGRGRPLDDGVESDGTGAATLAPDSDRGGREIRHKGSDVDGSLSDGGDRPNGGRPVDWGTYASAVERWERIIGRPPPPPVDGGGRLAAPFVEWLMGFPEGWCDGLSRGAALRCLGNAVLPLQGVHAIESLT